MPVLMCWIQSQCVGVCVFVAVLKWEQKSELDDVRHLRCAVNMTLKHSNEIGNNGTLNTTRTYSRDGSGNEEMNLQVAHLPRKAPKDTLPMPVANIQKQKKCSRKRVSAVQKQLVKRETDSDGDEKKEALKSTELRAELLHNTQVLGSITSKSTEQRL